VRLSTLDLAACHGHDHSGHDHGGAPAWLVLVDCTQEGCDKAGLQRVGDALELAADTSDGGVPLLRVVAVMAQAPSVAAGSRVAPEPDPGCGAPVARVVYDAEGAWHGAMGVVAGAGAALLVRPDGHVAWRWSAAAAAAAGAAAPGAPDARLGGQGGKDTASPAAFKQQLAQALGAVLCW
jgi:hypothetical protein